VLALAVREQLWETRLETAKQTGDGASTDRDRAATPAAPARKETGPVDRPRWGLFALVSGQLGLNGQESTWLGIGCTLGLEWHPLAGLLVKARASASALPLADPPDGELQGVQVEPGIGLGYLFPAGSISLGPVLGFQVPWTRLAVDLEGGEAQTFTWWNLRWSLGLEGRWLLSDWLALSGALESGVYRSKERFFRAEQGSLMLATPTFDLRLSLGLTLLFG
jgi:hypothetical protein